MLVLIRNRHTAKVQFGSLAGKRNLGCVAGGTVVQGHSIQQNIAVGFLLDIQGTDTYCTGMRFLQFIEVESGIFTNKHLYHLRCKKVHAIHCMVARQKTGLRTLFQNDKHTTVHHEIDVGTQNVH